MRENVLESKSIICTDRNVCYIVVTTWIHLWWLFEVPLKKGFKQCLLVLLLHGELIGNLLQRVSRGKIPQWIKHSSYFLTPEDMGLLFLFFCAPRYMLYDALISYQNMHKTIPWMWEKWSCRSLTFCQVRILIDEERTRYTYLVQ